MKLAADDVQTLVIPGCGHYPAEETPEQTLTALTAFLAPYRDEQAPAHHPRPAIGPDLAAPAGTRPAPKHSPHASPPPHAGGHGNARSCPDQGRAHQLTSTTAPCAGHGYV